MKPDREEALTLEILQAIEARSDVTQRHLADRMGVALGLMNSYLRRCVRKGLVKINQAPANRYLYYLTPKGFAEKSRLTAEYFAYSFSFYRTASESIERSLACCAERSSYRVVFCGISELAEIASVRAHDFRLEILGSFQPGSSLDKFVGKPVWNEIDAVPVVDVALFTALTTGDSIYTLVAAKYGEDKIIVPDIVQPLVSSGTT